MSDLTERLRHAHVHSAQRIMGSNIFEEAADEIDRLTRELAEAREALAWIDQNGENQDISHVDFRVEATSRARALKEKP